MAVRLLQPYAGQAVNTIYQGPDEATLKAISQADDYIERASDYASYVRGAVSGNLQAPVSQAGFQLRGVENITPETMRLWVTARAKLRADGTPARSAWVGDSKTAGAGAGTGGLLMDGALAKSRPSRAGALLANAGIPVVADAFFGTKGLGSIAAVIAYDPRLSGLSGWGGGVVVLGGSTLQTGNTNPLNFQPSKSVDRVSVLHRRQSGGATFTVAKGAESFSVDSNSAANDLLRTEITFATKSNSPIIITRTGGGSMEIAGLVAWDSAAPGVEISNFGVYGTVSSFHTVSTNPYSPLNALAYYAPHLTIINLGTNDLAQSVPLETYIANIRALVNAAKTTSSVILCWPAIGVNATFGDDATRAQWRATLRSLAIELGCGFVDEDKLLGGRIASQAAGAFADTIHERAWAYDVQADTLSAVIR